MPKRIPVQSVHVMRDGKFVRPAINKPFDFTAQELEDIKASNPDAVITLGDDEPLITSNESQAGELVFGGSGTVRADAAAAEEKPVVTLKAPAKKSDVDKDL